MWRSPGMRSSMALTHSGPPAADAPRGPGWRLESPPQEQHTDWTFGGSGYHRLWAVCSSAPPRRASLGDSGVQSIGSGVSTSPPATTSSLSPDRSPAAPRTSPPTSSPGSPSRCWNRRDHRWSSRSSFPLMAATQSSAGWRLTSPSLRIWPAISNRRRISRRSASTDRRNHHGYRPLPGRPGGAAALVPDVCSLKAKGCHQARVSSSPTIYMRPPGRDPGPAQPFDLAFQQLDASVALGECGGDIGGLEPPGYVLLTVAS
jgi:hypothetical protein